MGGRGWGEEEEEARSRLVSARVIISDSEGNVISSSFEDA
jgi:hypothetical protein